MAIITKGGTPSKGSATSFTLNITDLLAHASVSGDAYFSIQSNWDKVFLNYTSSIGGQKDFVIYKAVDSGTSDVADFSVFSSARDVFEIDSVVILDKQGGTLEIPRASLVAAEFDVSFNSGASQSYRYFKFDFVTLASVDSSGGSPSLVGITELQNDLGSGMQQISGVTPTYAGSTGTLSELFDNVTFNQGVVGLVYAPLTSDLILDYGTPTEVSGFRFFAQNSNDSSVIYNQPTQLIISGSNDNSNYTEIQTFNIVSPTFSGPFIVTAGDWTIVTNPQNGIYVDLIFS